MVEQAETRIAKWKLYSPWIVLVLGLAATTVIWRALEVHEVQEIGWATQLAAESIRADFQEDMEWQRIGLDRLGLLWEGADPRHELWIRNAELYIDHRPGCVAVEWVGERGDRRLVVAKTQATPLLAYNGLPTAAMDVARSTRTTVFSMPRQVGDGTAQWAVVHPVYTNDTLRGYVISFFDVARSVDSNLAEVKGLGFSFAVLFPDQSAPPTSTTNRDEERWAQTVPLPLAGVEWQLRVWPNPNTMVRIRSLLPQIALIVGTLLSLLSFLTLYFATRVARSSARVSLANETLQKEIAVREGVEQELRRTRDELELRVQNRTGELGTANALLQKEVAAHEHTEESLRQLTGQLFQLRDEEQRRLALELHDGATQTLIALAMNLALIRDAVPTEAASTRALVSESAHLLQQCTEELRTISYLLHPPLLSELGLATALQDFVEGFQNRSGIKVRLTVDPELDRLDQQLELTIFRVVQAALSNIRRHAHSATAAITLEHRAGLLHLEVTDNGCGIPPEVLAPSGSPLIGMGITGMRERVRLMGGRLEIHSSGDGTTIQVVVPAGGPRPATRKEPAGSDGDSTREALAMS